MVHRTLTPFTLTEQERRSHVSRGTPELMQQYEFLPVKAEQAPAHVGAVRGDRVYVRSVGWFAVMLHLPKGSTRMPSVYVNNGSQWGAPSPHRHEYAAVLDAIKVAHAFTATMCAGD